MSLTHPLSLAMGPKHKQAASLSGTSPTETLEKGELVKARALKRAERAEARRVKAEKRKEAGNAYFRAGDYPNAIGEYEAAIDIHGPSPASMSNMAAALLKLEDYDGAETCAQRALVLDPLFMKARYRRGLARKGNVELARAAVDFRVILKQDPNSTEAKDALREALTQMRLQDDELDVADSDDEVPALDAEKAELESVSDSSDWNHDGNGIPCRFYNRDGCKHGTACKYSHSPDHKSVRDRLGRNVCMYFLLECCRFGDSACVYSHDKTYLPSGRWWEDEDKCHTLRHILHQCGPIDYMPSLFAQVDRRIPWASAHGVDKEEEYEPWRNHLPAEMRAAIEVTKVREALAALRGRNEGPSRGGRGRTGRGKGKRGRRGESEMEERMANFGFTEDEVSELLCQGVKPWDEDAWDVRNALYSL
ncbi:hypothetical protein BJV74DRAFT_851408 [Russula compacta]|nr:hypothetical protein BJV74DRAFT_851408 [Russula compacta]